VTVAELREILSELSDNMICASHDAGGYVTWEFFGAEVVKENDFLVEGGLPRPFLLISAA